MTEPRPDWPDVLPGAFTVTPRRAPYAVLLGLAALVVVVLAVVASNADSSLRFPLLALAAVVALLSVPVFYGFLQAGRPQLVADAAGVKTTLTPMRIPWDRIERVRVMPGRRGRGGTIGVIPVSIEEALATTGDARMIKLLESRHRRAGAPLVVSLTATGISRDEALARLTELAAGRTPVTD